MRTLAQNKDAVAKLPANERRALSTWLASENKPEIGRDDEQRLLRSLDQAIRDIDADKGVPIEDVRKHVGSWAIT